MDMTLKSQLEDAQNSLLETFEYALYYGDDASKDVQVYLKMFEDAQKIKELALRDKQALEKAKTQTTLEQFECEYQNAKLQQKKSIQTKKTNEYKNFEERLKQIKVQFDNCEQNDQNGPSTGQQNRVECEEFVMETEVNIFDPLTKRQMTNPVKNRICGHHYEKSSILEAIKINPRLRCPVAGCGNNQFVKQNDLMADLAFKRQIEQMIENDNDDDDPLL